ncbi:hypothetical protein [Microbacterium sp.]|uniref:hypothetical protein n=1 Tax=Microbacterium sp. TaxID=51671 RepID=UPI002810B53C|nr:hypothetical protein [Microbacterium sp.]
MSDATQPNDPADNGMDKGTGDPGDDRAHLMDQPPAQADDDEQDEDDPEHGQAG